MNEISGFMGRDHDRLDELFAEIRKESDPAKARGWFAKFDSGLRAHIAWEEEILFPHFEAKTGMRDAGPTAVMRMEHDEIKQQLRNIDDAIGKRDPSPALDALVDVLTPHNQKEENVLYPWLDQSLSEAEKSAALDRIRAAQAAG